VELDKTPAHRDVVQLQKRRRADSNRRIRVLQTLALTSWLRRHKRKMGFGPTTSSLARRRSTTELLPLKPLKNFVFQGDSFFLVPRRRFELLRALPTTPSRWRVYRFRHLGAGVGGFEPPTCAVGVLNPPPHLVPFDSITPYPVSCQDWVLYLAVLSCVGGCQRVCRQKWHSFTGRGRVVAYTEWSGAWLG
jgi:hypothetical protein